MRTVVYKKIDNKLLDEWQALWDISCDANYTNSPQWFLSVIETFNYLEYVVIAVYKKNTLVSIGGMVKEKKYGVTYYTVAPGDFVCGFPFLVNSNDKKILAAIKKQLLALGNVFLTNIPEEFISPFRNNKPDVRAIVQAANFVYSLDKDVNGRPYVGKRNKLLHSVKGMEELFTVKIYDGTSSEALKTVFALDKNSSKHSRGYSAFASSEVKDFYRNLAKHFKENMRINILYYKNVPIAYEIGFTAGKTYFGNQIAYKSKYKKYVPGKVLIVNLLESHAKEGGIEKMDFGSGDNHIKRAFTKNYNQFYQVVVSESKFINTYIPLLFKVKNELYTVLQDHLTIYFAYRSVKKRIFAEN